MLHARTCVIGALLLSLLGWTSVNDLSAQEVRKALDDYVRAKPFQYQPSDPWVRSKLFQIHTKHYGWFYNCDDEECKRQSPYICWKTHHERDLPNWMTGRERIRHELNQIRQRIYDGAGMCAVGCQCRQCQVEHSASHQQTCDCQQCLASNGPAVEAGAPVRQAESPSQRLSQQLAEKPVVRTAGLLSRVAEASKEVQRQTVESNFETKRPERIAEQGTTLLDRLRSVRR